MLHPEAELKLDNNRTILKQGIREIIITVLLAVTLFVAIRSVVHNFEVSGFSMEPTLHNRQFLVVSKVAYWFGNPDRGDVVVFKSPRLNRGIIHRIIGLPGDMVEIKQGEAYINRQRLVEPYIRGNQLSVAPVKVPDGAYFIVGDNRGVPGDALGVASWDIVPEDDIIGKAWLKYWPIGDWGLVRNYSWKKQQVDNGAVTGSRLINSAQSVEASGVEADR